jgi:hypothetical protein
MPEPATLAPAYYAARGSGWRQWWTILHPPYTAWHLAYVVTGAALAPRPTLTPLLAAVGAFLLAVGVAAHAVDELHGRPLRTTISDSALRAAAVTGLAGAGVLGALGVLRVGWVLIPFIVAGPLLVVGYNAEILGGLLHRDIGFAFSWGAFPVLVGYVAEAHTLAVAPAVAAAGAVALSLAQRHLSTSARHLRRNVESVEGTMHMIDGSAQALDASTLLVPTERALSFMSWSIVLLAAALAVARMT